MFVNMTHLNVSNSWTCQMFDIKKFEMVKRLWFLCSYNGGTQIVQLLYLGKLPNPSQFYAEIYTYVRPGIGGSRGCARRTPP